MYRVREVFENEIVIWGKTGMFNKKQHIPTKFGARFFLNLCVWRLCNKLKHKVFLWGEEEEEESKWISVFALAACRQLIVRLPQWFEITMLNTENFIFMTALVCVIVMTPSGTI